ncbi:hypothetical protein DID75_01075 [Candidatus Marinamargulisbacteria bacterium SCGC AG-410-N11]|nr:hypothetical protein DID75_01075 [Candidatus Marinamargulisbacteria bacterium SCGC AG-410-N11]
MVRRWFERLKKIVKNKEGKANIATILTLIGVVGIVVLTLEVAVENAIRDKHVESAHKMAFAFENLLTSEIKQSSEGSKYFDAVTIQDIIALGLDSTLLADIDYESGTVLSLDFLESKNVIKQVGDPSQATAENNYNPENNYHGTASYIQMVVDSESDKVTRIRFFVTLVGDDGDNKPITFSGKNQAHEFPYIKMLNAPAKDKGDVELQDVAVPSQVDSDGELMEIVEKFSLYDGLTIDTSLVDDVSALSPGVNVIVPQDLYLTNTE